MTVLNEPTTAPADQQTTGNSDASSPEINVGSGERAISVAAGSILTVLGLSRRSIPGLLMAGIGGSLIYRGSTGQCSLYKKLGIDTAHQGEVDGPDSEKQVAERGIHVEQAFLINRSPEDLYAFWRDFKNLPQIMSHVKSIDVKDEKHSHWAVTGPAGSTVEWDAEITQDEPGKRIAWKSLPGSDVDTVGELRFTPAMGDRGTEVHVFMDYVPPAGKLGHWIATAFGKAPRRQMREDLRNFKRLMETGELPTTEGQPRGTCLGGGTRD